MSEQKSNPHLEEARQHLRAAHQAIRESFEALLPPKFVEQRRKARKEMLLAMRSILDAVIEHGEQGPHQTHSA